MHRFGQHVDEFKQRFVDADPARQVAQRIGLVVKRAQQLRQASRALRIFLVERTNCLTLGCPFELEPELIDLLAALELTQRGDQ